MQYDDIQDKIRQSDQYDDRQDKTERSVPLGHQIPFLMSLPADVLSLYLGNAMDSLQITFRLSSSPHSPNCFHSVSSNALGLSYLFFNRLPTNSVRQGFMNDPTPFISSLCLLCRDRPKQSYISSHLRSSSGSGMRWKNPQSTPFAH